MKGSKKTLPSIVLLLGAGRVPLRFVCPELANTYREIKYLIWQIVL